MVFRDDPKVEVVGFTATQIPGIARSSMVGPAASISARVEEYELPVAMGVTVWAGADYQAILDAAAAEADVLVWDGGNNDLPFFAPDVLIAVADTLRPGHETTYHPGEAVLRRADVVLVNKVDGAEARVVDDLVAAIGVANPGATIIRAASPVTLDAGPSLAGVTPSRAAVTGRPRR